MDTASELIGQSFDQQSGARFLNILFQPDGVLPMANATQGRNQPGYPYAAFFIGPDPGQNCGSVDKADTVDNLLKTGMGLTLFRAPAKNSDQPLWVYSYADLLC